MNSFLDSFKGRGGGGGRSGSISRSSGGSRSGSVSRSSAGGRSSTGVSTGVLIAAGGSTLSDEPDRTAGSGGSYEPKNPEESDESDESDKPAIDDRTMTLIIIICVIVGVIVVYGIVDFVMDYKKYKDNNANGTFLEFIKQMWSSDKSDEKKPSV